MRACLVKVLNDATVTVSSLNFKIKKLEGLFAKAVQRGQIEKCGVLRKKINLLKQQKEALEAFNG